MDSNQFVMVERSILVTLLEWAMDAPLISGDDYDVAEYFMYEFGAGRETALTNAQWQGLAAVIAAERMSE